MVSKVFSPGTVVDSPWLNDVNSMTYGVSVYSELRQYRGPSPSVRVVSSTIGGLFIYNSSDTTSSDNGGTIIVDVLGRRWYRQFTGDVKAAWFGVDFTGVVDSTTALQAAISYLISTRSGVGLGLGTLVLDRGVILVNGTIALGEARGLTIQGQGFGATEIRRTIDTGTLFTQTLYSYLKFSDLGINHTGSIPNKGTWTNTCWDLSGSNIGQNFILERVRVHGFNKQIDFGSRTVNGDTNYGVECYFTNFNSFLEATNNQGIINNFSKCTWVGTVNSIFKIAGFGHTHLDTCNIVMSGKFLDLSGNGGPQSIYMMDNCKFEFWPQGGAIGTTQLVTTSASTNVKIMFRGGGLAGGTPDPTVYQIENRTMNGTIEFEGGNWASTIKIRNYRQVLTSTFGATTFNTYTKFKNCTISPSPANVLFDATGATNQSYPGVIWEDCQDRTNLCMTGSGNGDAFNAAVPPSAIFNRATFTGVSTGGNIMNGNNIVVLPFPHYGQLAFLRTVRLLIKSQGTLVTGTLKVFSDAARTVQIGSTLTLSSPASTIPKVVEFTIPADTVISDGVYLELTNSNGVFMYGRVYIETMSI